MTGKPEVMPDRGTTRCEPDAGKLCRQSDRNQNLSVIARLDTLGAAMDDDLTFDEFAEWLREYWHVPIRKAITPETQFERDLGLTGDDGDDLLEATEKRFEVRLGNEETGVRETFNLQPNEYLFNSEGWGPSRAEIISLFSGSPTVVRNFKVGELFEAVKRIKTSRNDASSGVAPG
jgi:hypothetical protein